MGELSPITEPYWKKGLCPVNVHWHLGAEHYSVGEYDENGKGSREIDWTTDGGASDALGSFQCHHYDPEDSKFTRKYDWKHCIGMEVGQIYEVHWPHSAAGGTCFASVDPLESFHLSIISAHLIRVCYENN